MDIQQYIVDQLSTGKTMEEIMASIADSANAAEKAYAASKVKDYTQPLRSDEEILSAIQSNSYTTAHLAEMILYWLGREYPEFYIDLSAEAINPLKDELGRSLAEVGASLGRVIAVLGDNTKTDWEKLFILGAEAADMQAMKRKKPKTDVLDDSQEIKNMMMKLGF